jgi:hypothetical protein
MSVIKKTLRSELGIRTRTSNKLDEEKEEDYVPQNLLAEQTTNAVNEYFNEREEIYQEFPDEPDKEELELTADVFDCVPRIAPVRHENQGLFENLQQSSTGLTSTNTYSTNLPFQNMGGVAFGNNYNGYGLKNSVLPQDGLTIEKIKRGFYTNYQYQPTRYWGQISDDALLESMGYLGQKKYQGIPS